MDIATILGLIVGVGMILFGQYLEGGHASSVLALPPVFIVFGGTLGCVLVGAPMKDVIFSFKQLRLAFGKAKKHSARHLIGVMCEMAKVARRDGLLALDAMVADIDNDFMKGAVRHMVDGVDSGVLREILEADIDKHEEELGVGAKFWEAAGGYSPTIGIVGAVLGLIHTMENLNDPSQIGAGIATAFVATIYGVAGANMFFLPVAAKLKRKVQMIVESYVMIMEGVLAVQAGHNSHVIAARLEMYAKDEPVKDGEGADGTAPAGETAAQAS